MSKLPYKYTICPPGPEPKQFTASCADIGRLLKNSPNGDLTINNGNQRWESWTNKPMAIAPIEDILSAMVRSTQEKT